ncbi:ABC transporter substrate-binding protein [Sphingorhabdus sp.]|jgi:iron complex transport system substrate-binding protein|uniref:ABC transporter substrate-binding protein n=1 Tax=Sphingorhabdus sp. TaxID=1902408 RepID=UPI0037CB4335
MRFGWCLLWAFALAGCASQPVIAPHGVVSNNPCIDAVLAHIAMPGQVTAVSIYSHDPDSASAPLAWARQLPAIGISAEELLLSRPKMVLTGNLASSGINAVLARAGIQTLALGVAPTIADDMQQIRTIAAALGRGDAGEALISDIEESLPSTQFSGTNVSAIIWQNGGFVAGKGTLQDELLAHHGFRNASAQYGLSSWGVLPLETLMRNPPQVIFMPTHQRGSDARQMRARQKLLAHLGGRTRIIEFPDRLLFCGGPTIIKVSAILAKTRASFGKDMP